MKSSGASKGSIPGKPFKVSISKGDSAASRQWLRNFKFSRLLYILAGLLLAVAGMILVTLALIGMIHPWWLGNLLVMLGSIATMTGIFVIYDQKQQYYAAQQLLKEAIERVYRSQN